MFINVLFVCYLQNFNVEFSEEHERHERLLSSINKETANLRSALNSEVVKNKELMLKYKNINELCEKMKENEEEIKLKEQNINKILDEQKQKITNELTTFYIPQINELSSKLINTTNSLNELKELYEKIDKEYKELQFEHNKISEDHKELNIKFTKLSDSWAAKEQTIQRLQSRLNEESKTRIETEEAVNILKVIEQQLKKDLEQLHLDYNKIINENQQLIMKYKMQNIQYENIKDERDKLYKEMEIEDKKLQDCQVSFNYKIF